MPTPTHPVHLTAEAVTSFHQLSGSPERIAHRKRWQCVRGSFREESHGMTNLLTTLAVAHVVQAIIVGGVLAFLTAQVIMNAVVKAMTTTVNGWSTTVKAGQPGNGILLRAACARILPAVTVVQEAAYWTTTVDSAGRRLNGQRDYILQFPVGHLPPNEAFWSLTMTDVVGYLVRTPIDRSSVGSRSGLVPNADGA